MSAALLTHPDLEPPFVSLVVSGGHTSLIHVRDYSSFHLLGQTRDDAAGEAFDKVARLLGLPYPGGPHVEALAATGDPLAIRFPRSFAGEDSFEFSFSGLKTAVLNVVSGPEWDPERMADLAAEFQHAVAEVLCAKALAALKKTGLKTLVVAGGVGANQHLRQVLDEALKIKGGRVHYPEPALCTDNGAMIAFAGALRLAAGEVVGGEPAVRIRPRWPLAELQPPQSARQ